MFPLFSPSVCDGTKHVGRLAASVRAIDAARCLSCRRSFLSSSFCACARVLLYGPLVPCGLCRQRDPLDRQQGSGLFQDGDRAFFFSLLSFVFGTKTQGAPSWTVGPVPGSALRSASPAPCLLLPLRLFRRRVFFCRCHGPVFFLLCCRRPMCTARGMRPCFFSGAASWSPRRSGGLGCEEKKTGNGMASEDMTRTKKDETEERPAPQQGAPATRQRNKERRLRGKKVAARGPCVVAARAWSAAAARAAS